MNLNLVKQILPKYSAAVAQMGEHGADAARSVMDAKNATTPAARLDAAVQAYNSFDHAITSSKDLPVKWLAPGVGKYYGGYSAAKAAATLIVGSGLVPGAREIAGRAEITAGRSEFHDGLSSYAADASKFGRYRSLDWLRASQEDATNAVLMLRKPELARPLLGGLAATADLVQSRKPVPEAQVKRIDDLFRQATTAFDTLIERAERQALAEKGAAPAPAPVTAA